jgi:hypothetical protein
MLYGLDSVHFTNHKSVGYEYWMTKTVQPPIARSLYGNAAYNIICQVLARIRKDARTFYIGKFG